MTVRAKADICSMIQWVAILIAICSGVYVVLTGEAQLGIGVIAAALSSAHVVTNKLPRCVNGHERRMTNTEVQEQQSCDTCPTREYKASEKE